MAEQDDTSGEKSHDPTPQKLEKARKKGDIAKSADVTVAASYFGLLIAFLLAGGYAATMAASGLMIFLSQPDRLTGQILGPGGGGLSAQILLNAVAGTVPLFLVPFAAVLVALFAQRALIFAPDKIQPKLNRISPISGAKNKFGMNGIVEFLKTLVKMLAVSTIVGSYLYRKQDEIFIAAKSGHQSLMLLMGSVLIDLLTLVSIFAVMIGVVDFLWQNYSHNKKLQMSFQELRDENKEAEGDPHTKNQRRQRGRDIATNRMLIDVPTADVIVVNPLHYAVALKWDRNEKTAPKCIAKGVDEIAARIREVAMTAGVPIHKDPPTARAIHATTEIGEEIHPDQYRAIAAALRYAEKMRRKAREQGLS